MRLIDADALREDLRRFFPVEVLGGIEPKILFAQIMHDIDNAPTVETPTIYEFNGCDNCELERPKGKWITNREYIDKEFNGHYEGNCFNSPYNCSCCGYSPKDNRPNFCPNCGADMRGAE